MSIVQWSKWGRKECKLCSLKQVWQGACDCSQDWRMEEKSHDWHWKRKRLEEIQEAIVGDCKAKAQVAVGLPRCWRFQSQESSPGKAHTDSGSSQRGVCATGAKMEGGAQILDMVLQALVFVLPVFSVTLVQSSFTMSLFLLIE